MTLSDAFHTFAAALHSKTMRPHLAYSVVNAANDNRGAL
jgi:hypothetical protein